MPLTKSVRHTSLVSVCFDASSDTPELCPDTFYGTDVAPNIEVYNDSTKSACYIRLNGNLFSVEDIQRLLDEANDFHSRLKPL